MNKEQSESKSSRAGFHSKNRRRRDRIAKTRESFLDRPTSTSRYSRHHSSINNMLAADDLDLT